jgi:type III secretion protein C
VFQDVDGLRIKLMVSIEDGRISGEKVDQIPVVDRSTINTQAVMLEGESLLIGGMTRDANDSKVDKVPLLGDIPGIGALFRSKADSNTRIERLILITPRLIDSRRTIASVGTQRAQEPVPQRAVPAMLVPPTSAAVSPASAVAAPVPARAASVAQQAAPSEVVAIMPSVTQSWSASRRGSTAPSGCAPSAGGGRC